MSSPVGTFDRLIVGRGIALQFKHAYPANFKEYAAACKRGDVQPGRTLMHDTGQLRPRWIVNFPTKRHWRGRCRLEDIRSGMGALVDEIRARDIRSIAVPPLLAGDSRLRAAKAGGRRRAGIVLGRLSG